MLMVLDYDAKEGCLRPSLDFFSLESDPFLLSGLNNLCIAREHALQLRVKSEEVFKGIKDAICLHADVRNSIDTTADGS